MNFKTLSDYQTVLLSTVSFKEYRFQKSLKNKTKRENKKIIVAQNEQETHTILIDFISPQTHQKSTTVSSKIQTKTVEVASAFF